MVELTDRERQVVEAIRSLGATDETKLKTVDHIQKIVRLPKGLVANLILELIKKGVVKKVTREKAAGYYLAQI